MTLQELYFANEAWAIDVGLKCARRITNIGEVRIPHQFVVEYAAQSARAGLWEACVRWRETAGFKTFARSRVTGEVKDEARRLYGVSFSQNRKSRVFSELPDANSERMNERSCK